MSHWNGVIEFNSRNWNLFYLSQLRMKDICQRKHVEYFYVMGKKISKR